MTDNPAEVSTTTDFKTTILDALPNRYLSQPSDHTLLFKLSRRDALGNKIATYSIIGLLAAMLGYILVNPLSVKMNMPVFIPVAAFCTVGLAWFFFIALADLRKLNTDQIEFDTAARTYCQISVDKQGWKQSYQEAKPIRWGAPRIMSGSIDRDLLGIGLYSTVVPKSLNYRYQVVTVWRDDAQPGALLSQYYVAESDATDEMQNIAKLLGAPAMGVLGI